MFKLVNILITQLVSNEFYHINDLIKSHGKYVWERLFIFLRYTYVQAKSSQLLNSISFNSLYRKVEILVFISLIQIIYPFLTGFITQPSVHNQLMLIKFGRCFDYTSVTETSIGSLSNDVFERRTSVGRGLFVLFGRDFEINS